MMGSGRDCIAIPVSQRRFRAQLITGDNRRGLSADAMLFMRCEFEVENLA